MDKVLDMPPRNIIRQVTLCTTHQHNSDDAAMIKARRSVPT